MSKIGLLFNYWIYMLVVLFVSKAFGLADSAIILFTTLAIATLAYIPIIKFFMAKQNKSARATSEKPGKSTRNTSGKSGKSTRTTSEKSGKSVANRKKKKAGT